MSSSCFVSAVRTNFILKFQASAHNKNLDVGANIFIGNLDPEIDEKLLYDTFSAFGVILQTPKVMHFTCYHLQRATQREMSEG